MQVERILDARSDDLASAEGLVTQLPEVRWLMRPTEHLPLVIDTNRVLQDIGWLARRRTVDARNFLEELTAAGMASLYAPEHLIREVETNLSEFAENLGVDRDRLDAAWRSYASLIHFLPAEHLDLSEPDTATRDPSDVPFLAAQRAVGAHGIISTDKDLVAMGALVVKHEALRLAVEFARNKSVVVQGNTGIAGISTLGVGLVYGTYKASAALVRCYRRLPGWLQILIPLVLASAAAFALLHKPTREKVRDFVRRPKPWLADVRSRAGEFFEQYLTEMQDAEGKAKAALGLLRQQVPIPTRRPTLKQLAYRVCVASSEPVSLDEIVVGVRRHGYPSTSTHLHRYLRTVLRKDRRLVPNADMCWTLSKRPVLPGPLVSASAPS